MKPSPFSPIPEDTRQAAISIYGAGQAYIMIGDQDQSFLGGLDFGSVSMLQRESKDTIALLFLVTLFQYRERLSDAQAAQATGQRIDWKYALHLPMAYPGIAPSMLCSFRQWVTKSPTGVSMLQNLIERCAALGLSLAGLQSLPEPIEVVEVNCLKNCLDLAVNVMLPAIEVLAAESAPFLQKIALPHWYSRYLAPHRGLQQASSREELMEMICSLERDIDHLCKAIHSHPDVYFTHYPEIQTLLRLWKEGNSQAWQSPIATNLTHFRLDCSKCMHPQSFHSFTEPLIH